MFIRKRAHIGTDLLLVVSSIMYLCIQRLDQSSSQCMVVRSKWQVHHYQAFFSEINWHFIFFSKTQKEKKLKKKKKSVDLQFFSKLLLVCLKKLVTKLCNNIVHQQYTTMQQSSANMPLLFGNVYFSPRNKRARFPFISLVSRQIVLLCTFSNHANISLK